MSEADEHLLALIRDGNQDGWGQFVSRFQGRLIAYATRQVDQLATAEDLVQDTFVGFLQSINNYREQGELESFLFQILRRRIVDHYRRRGQNRELPACGFQAENSELPQINSLDRSISKEPNASTYVRNQEQNDEDRNSLAAAIERLANELQTAAKFRDLKVAEGLFYAQLRSLELAKLLQISENEIAVVKYRLIERLAKSVQLISGASTREPVLDLVATNLLTTVWESMRPSCPKRSTLGKYILKILPPDWEDFITFHLVTLSCTFCNANLMELQTSGEVPDKASQHMRLFNSTIGFLNRGRA